MTLVAIISAKRPHQVSHMESHLDGLNPVWFVPENQILDYQNAGASKVVGVQGEMPMKSKQLNAALNEGFSHDEKVVTLDDDFYQIKKVYLDGTKIKSRPYTLKEAIQEMLDSLDEYPYHLAGVGASLNALFAGVGIKHTGKVVGQITAQSPNIVRYDENLTSQVDFEYCFAHHAEHKGVILHKSILSDFHMYGRNEKKDKNYSGGLAGLRTNESNLKTARIMTDRYGVYVEAESVGQSRKSRIKYKDISWVGKPSWIM